MILLFNVEFLEVASKYINEISFKIVFSLSTYIALSQFLAL